ncbi:MAG: ISAs1 family transposase, partial [Bacilli bacterium]|nr:ISAs1 family transposase [Bacilli bacterium]
EDFRDIRGKKHELVNIIIMTIYGVLCGYTDFVNMADFLELNEEYFITLLNLENGIPSHDTFSRVFASLNSKELMDIFINWTKDVVKEKGLHIALDGKAIKSARDKINNGNIPYILSGFLCDIGLSIGQIKVDDKSNEITAIPELLDLIDFKGKIITIDAIGTQEDIANKIVIDKKAAYMLKVKDNQKDLKDDIKTYFDLELKKDSSDIAIAETNYEKNHGRIEKRTYYISYDTECISDKNKWKTVKAIGRIDVYREEYGKVSITKNYYILSEKFNIDRFINVTREHWNIECSLHWRLDVILNEDHSTNKKDNSIDNLTIIRKIVFNLARLDNSMGNLTLKKKLTRYAFDFQNIENLIFNVIPSI